MTRQKIWSSSNQRIIVCFGKYKKNVLNGKEANKKNWENW